MQILNVGYVSAEDAERFWAKVRIVDDETSCWLYDGGLFGDGGYGAFWYISRNVGAHVMSYMITQGAIPERHHVLHTCDNMPCARPDHVYAGTPQQNMQDKVARGRWKGGSPKGDRSAARLNPQRGGSQEQADEIRRLYATGDYTQRELGPLFDITQTMVWRIVNNKAWVRESVS